MADGPVFPAFLKLEYQRDSSAKSSFLDDVATLAGEAQRQFEGSFSDVGKMLERSLSSFKSGGFNLDLDMPGLRKAAADADFAAQRLRLLRDAAKSLAADTGDTSLETQSFIKALRAQTIEAEQSAQAANEQVLSFQKLQNAMTMMQAVSASTAIANQELADSFRATFAEQAKAANYADAFQKAINHRFAPGLSVSPKSAQDSADVFADMPLNRGFNDQRNFVEQYTQGRQAADGLVTASVTLDTVLGRVAGKSKEVAAALKDAAESTQRRVDFEATQAAAARKPQNTTFGVEALVAGKASIDRAALSGATLESVLGRVSVKGKEVAAALREASDEAAQAAEQEADRVEKAKAAEAAALEMAAQKAKEYAAAAETLRSRLDPALAVQQRFDAEMRMADELLAAGAISSKEYGAAQTLATQNLQRSWDALTKTQEEHTAATKRGTSETSNVINGIRAQRVAFTQLGQQMQDVVVQTQMGTNATTIFVQQAPQMAFALSGLEGNINKTFDRVGKFASFLAGPWGAAVFAAIAVLGPFAADLLSAGDAADDAAKSNETLADKLDLARNSMDQVTAAMRDYNREQAKANALTLDGAEAVRKKAQEDLNAALAIRKKLAAQLEEYSAAAAAGPTGLNGQGQLGAAIGAGVTSDLIKKNDSVIKELQDGVGNSAGAVAEERAKLATDPSYAVTQRFKALRNEAKAAIPDVDALTARLTALDRQEKAAQDALKPERKSKGAKSSNKAEKEAERLAQMGDRAAESIQRLNERFNEQPKLVDEAAQATRQLDDIIADLEKRKPAGFETMVADAEAAKQVVQDALVRPYRQLAEDSERRLKIQNLLSSGRQAEAAAMQDIWQLENRLGPMTEERKAEVIAIAKAEQDQIEALQRVQEIQAAYLDATRSVRQEVEAILGGYGKISNLKGIFQQLQGKILAENLFGDVFRDLDKWVKEKTGIGSSVDMMAKETERAGASAGRMADAIDAAVASISGVASTGDPMTASTAALVDQALGLANAGSSVAPVKAAANDNGLNATGEPIVVSGVRSSPSLNSVTAMTPERYAAMLSDRLTKPLLDGFDRILGADFAKKLSGPLSGAMEGFMTTGTGFGAVLGGLKDLKGLPKGLSDGLGKAFGGAQTGSQVAGIGNSLGIKMSNTGAQIGGAIGSFLPIPGGQIIGAIAGGLLGNLFATVKSGYAQVRNGTVAGTYGRTSDLETQASSTATELIATISSLADKLGVKLGGYDFDIGKKDDKYVVNTGQRGTFSFSDAKDAMEFAIREAVSDGAFNGLSDAAKRLLQKSGDLQAQIDKAVSFQNVFKQLKAIKDPVGAALDTLDAQFQKLQDIFKEAGASAAEYAQLEELYGIERAKAIKQATDQITASLKGLYDELTVGNSALSLSDRKAQALATYQPLADRVKAGDTTAYDDYAAAARQLLDIERQMSGSQSDYFALLDEVTNLTKTRLDATTAAADASANRDSPFTNSTGTTAANDNASVTSALDALGLRLLDGLGYKLDAVNQNLGSIIQQGLSNGSIVPDYSKLTGTGSW